MQAFDPEREELEFLAGDQPLPEKGLVSTTDLTQTAKAHPMIRYKDRVIEADLYEMGGQLMVHLLCPRCRHALKISSERKHMEWDRESLSVEPFTCTWELGRDTSGTDGDHIAFGLGLCGWRVAIDKNVARDA